jgi:hypothetical protein
MFVQKTLVSILGRTLAVLLAGTLAACAGIGALTSSDTTTPRRVAAGRGQVAPQPPPSPPPAADASGPPTIQQARAECWMSMETNKKAPKEPEKRLPLVEKCVQEKMAGPGVPPAPAAQ